MVFRGVAQLASALAWGARGRLFESDHPDNKKAHLSYYLIDGFFVSPHMSHKFKNWLIWLTQMKYSY
jgi:hypothetical protein